MPLNTEVKFLWVWAKSSRDTICLGSTQKFLQFDTWHWQWQYGQLSMLQGWIFCERDLARIIHSFSRFSCPIIPVIRSLTWWPLGNEILSQPSPVPILCGWTPVSHDLLFQWARSRKPQRPAGNIHCKPPVLNRLKIPTSPAEKRQKIQNSTPEPYHRKKHKY